MRVLFDYQAFSQKWGGVSRYHSELYAILPQFGIKAILPHIISDNYYLNIKKIRTRHLNLLFGKKYQPYVAAFLNQLICKQAIKKDDYDILHPTFVNPYYDTIKLNKPVVVTVHDLIQEKTQRFDALETGRRRVRQLEKASAIICVSNQTKNDLLSLYPEFSNKDIRIIHHGSNQEALIDYGPKPSLFPYLLYVGGRDSYKNFDTFLKSFARLPKDIHLICTGAVFNAEETQLIQDLKISDRIEQRFVTDNQLADLYHYALAFVYPSKMEGFGLPILEAFRCGCPAIVSDIECFHEVGGSGITYFNPNDPDSIHHQMIKIIEDANYRDIAVEYGRERLKQFSWEKTVEQHAKLYHELG